MKRIIALFLAAVMCLSLAACGGDTATEYAIGEAFGTDSVECKITEVRWITKRDVDNVDFSQVNDYGIVSASTFFPEYTFMGVSGFNLSSSDYPYLCVTFTLQNIGKTTINCTVQDNTIISYGNISVIYDDGYTFDAKEGFNTKLEVLGDTIYEGRILTVPYEVYANEDKPLRLKISLPNSNGETEEFIVSVR